MAIYVIDYLHENVITDLGCTIVPVGIKELENLVSLILDNDESVYLHTKAQVVFKYPDSKSVLRDVWWCTGDFNELSPAMQKMWDNAYNPKALDYLQITDEDIVYIFSHYSGNVFKTIPNQLPY